MQTQTKYLKQIEQHLAELSLNIGPRPTGSPANHRAAVYIKQIFTRNEFQVNLQEFDCIDWEKGGVILQTATGEIPAESSPYSLPCNVQANPEVLETISQLEQADLQDKIAVLRGELTTEPLMPKNFTFYNPEHHQKIIRLLEEKNPAAILTASISDAHLVPLFEDGDFDIPSAVISVDNANTIAENKSPIHLSINSARKKSIGANVIGRKNPNSQEKFVVTAHFDTKPGTPGALDNAAGVTVLLILSEMLKDMALADVDVELVAFNGEDYFSVPGQMAYLNTYQSEFSHIKLAANCDGVGLKSSQTGISPLACPDNYVDRIELSMQSFKDFETLPPWYQGDHMLFASAQVPTLAMTSTGIFELVDTVIHTDNDRPDLIDPKLILEACLFLKEVMKK